MEHHNRRRVLGALASLPALSGGALLTIDPVFGLIDQHQQLLAAWNATLDEAEDARLFKAELAAYKAVLTSKPSSRSGLQAKVDYIVALLIPRDAAPSFRFDVAPLFRD